MAEIDNPTPIMEWDSQDGFKDICCWWSRLDNRYQVEVHRTDQFQGYQGLLIIFDHDDGDKVLFKEPVGLAYDAIFGPDIDDVYSWQEKAIAFVDSLK